MRPVRKITIAQAVRQGDTELELWCVAPGKGAPYGGGPNVCGHHSTMHITRAIELFGEARGLSDMRRFDPIIAAPRVVSREWGREDLGNWRSLAHRSIGPVGEIWLHDAANTTPHGTIGRQLARDSHAMLGDLGRAPPRVRLVFPGRDVVMPSRAPVSFWTLLEPGSPLRRTGERIRAYEGAEVELPSGSVGLEVSAAFLPDNKDSGLPSQIRLPPVSRRNRATLSREEALSTEMWTLPPSSRLTPDGETCHVLVALTPGVIVDGFRLRPGQAMFLPAWGRVSVLEAEHAGAKVLMAYPDGKPTSIWQHVPGPDPIPGFAPRPRPLTPIAAAASLLSEAEAA